MSQSMLDMLRNRVAANMQNEGIARLSEFGAGMAASGSPNFFTMLSAGARAQREGDATRMEELRRVAEAERQAAAQQAEEQYRSSQLEIERQRRANEERRINAEIARGDRPQYTVVGQDADGNAIVMDPRTGQRQTLQGVTPLQVASRGAQSETQNRQLAARLAEAAVNREATNRSNMGRTFSDTDRAALRRQVEGDVLRSLGLEPVAGAGGASGTQGSQPSRVLTYPRTPE